MRFHIETLVDQSEENYKSLEAREITLETIKGPQPNSCVRRD